MSEPIVKVRVDAPSGTILLNRPSRRNALSREMITEIQKALSDLYQERKVRAVIISGAGSAFCAGLDLHEMHETQRLLSDMEQAGQWQMDALAYRDLLLTMLECPKPIIAAVNGPAIGGGAGVLLAADMVVAGESATVSVPGPRRGLVAGTVAPLFAFRVGGGWAANAMLSSRVVDSGIAKQIGLFQDVVPDDFVWAKAQEWATEVAAGSHESISMTKRMLNETVGETLRTMLTTGAAMTATARTTEAAREGIAAFVEKREPEWP